MTSAVHSRCVPMLWGQGYRECDSFLGGWRMVLPILPHWSGLRPLNIFGMECQQGKQLRLEKDGRKKMSGFILWSNYPIMNALKANHTRLSPRMQKGVSSTLRLGLRTRGFSWNGNGGDTGFQHRPPLDQPPGKGALGRYPRQGHLISLGT